MATATPTSECLKRRMGVALGPDGIGGGHTLERQSESLDDEIVDGEFCGNRGVGFFAQGEQKSDIDVGRQIEVRDRLLGFDQTAGDGPAHGVERDTFEWRVGNGCGAIGALVAWMALTSAA